MSIKSKIRAANDIDRVVLPVPEWDVTIEIRSMTTRQRANFIELNQQGEANTSEKIEGLYGQLLITACYDPETGDNVFDADDLSWLMTEKSGVVIDRLIGKCLEVSGLKEKAIDDMGKSYSASQTGTDADTLNSGTTTN